MITGYTLAISTAPADPGFGGTEPVSVTVQGEIAMPKNPLPPTWGF